jgi:hypothetical protein
MQLMARLAAIIAPPRYPLVRYSGVLGPRSSWRRDVVPKPREWPRACDEAARAVSASNTVEQPDRTRPKHTPKPAARSSAERERAGSVNAGLSAIARGPQVVDDGGGSELLAPNVIAIRHWERLLGGALYASAPRVDWARLLRRSFEVDVLECPKCRGRLRVLAVITEREPVVRILGHVGMATDVPPIARARDPTDDVDGEEADVQLELGLA